MQRPPFPPFSHDSAVRKVRQAEDAWNGQDPENIAMGYTPDCEWRNRSEFISGRDEIIAFLKRKWSIEHDYRLIKELWCCQDNRIAVRFAYEWRNKSGVWWRSYGNENWEFNAEGIMTARHASINDVLIEAKQRLFLWPLGRRPDDHPSLSELGL